MRVVVDTNVFVAALLSPDRAPRAVIRLCLQGHLEALMGNALFSEYEALMGRGELFGKCPLNADEREALFDAFAASSRWVKVHFLWRPNLRDEADNHLVELAVAGNAAWIITRNLRDLKSGELLFPEVRVGTPEDFLEQWS